MGRGSTVATAFALGVDDVDELGSLSACVGGARIEHPISVNPIVTAPRKAPARRFRRRMFGVGAGAWAASVVAVM